ncbi:MAG: GntR family transcriptional regulator [Thermomicrobiales bacterium]
MTDTYAAIESKRSPRRSRQSSREVAYDSIKRAILSGEIAPHERLVEERVAEALGISRTPVREAFAILEHEGMLESEPYKGLAVRPVTVDEFLNMYEALGIIEAALARLAATKASAGDIRRMDDALQQAERGIPNDVPEHLSGNREFQALLGAAADAPFLTRVLLGIEERSDMYLINSGLTLSEGNMRAAVADRRAILDRVRQGDADGAAEASLMHAARIRERWQQFYPGAA